MMKVQLEINQEKYKAFQCHTITDHEREYITTVLMCYTLGIERLKAGAECR